MLRIDGRFARAGTGVRSGTSHSKGYEQEIRCAAVVCWSSSWMCPCRRLEEKPTNATGVQHENAIFRYCHDHDDSELPPLGV